MGKETKATGATESKAVGIVLPEMDVRKILLTLEGTASLIVHRFGEKARKQIADKEQDKASAGREARKPREEFEAAKYKDAQGRDCFPASAFKRAAVSACTSLGKSISKTAARQSHHVCGDLVPIRGKATMREDVVRIGRGAASMRYRPEYTEWEVTLEITYNAKVMSAEQIVNLYNIAGFAVGVGEWRPERNGSFGQFRVAREKR